MGWCSLESLIAKPSGYRRRVEIRETKFALTGGQHVKAVPHYNYFRDCDPALGRYLESDRIGLDGGLSTYGYVKSRPLMWRDPNGLEAVMPGGASLPGWLGDALGSAGRFCSRFPLILMATGSNGGDSCADDPSRKRKECKAKRDKEDDCYEQCKHLMPSPSGDLQSSEFRKCYRECMGSLW